MRHYRTLAECLDALARGMAVDERDNGLSTVTVRALQACSGKVSVRRYDLMYRAGLRSPGAIVCQQRFERGDWRPIAWFWYSGALTNP